LQEKLILAVAAELIPGMLQGTTGATSVQLPMPSVG